MMIISFLAVKLETLLMSFLPSVHKFTVNSEMRLAFTLAIIEEWATMRY